MFKFLKSALLATVFFGSFVGANKVSWGFNTAETTKVIILVNPESAGIIDQKTHPLWAFRESAKNNGVSVSSELWKMAKYEAGSEDNPMFEALSDLLSPQDPSTSVVKNLVKLGYAGKQIDYPNHITGHFFVEFFEENNRPDIAQIVKDVMRNKKLGKTEV